MASEIEICNLALSHLGSYTINSLLDASQEARKCKLYYPYARDFVLRNFPWNFAEKRINLAEVSGVTPIGYDYAYQYPSDCLKARKIYNEVSGGNPIDFIINATDDLIDKLIYTNEQAAILIYTAKITDPNLFDSVFINALSYRLASDIAIALTKKANLQQMMLQLYTQYMSMAQTANASESKDTTQYENPFIAARF